LHPVGFFFMNFTVMHGSTNVKHYVHFDFDNTFFLLMLETELLLNWYHRQVWS